MFVCIILIKININICFLVRGDKDEIWEEIFIKMKKLFDLFFHLSIKNKKSKNYLLKNLNDSNLKTIVKKNILPS